jgi:hypothetical protein
LASYAWDGSLSFLGRIDEQVKLRGYRIELGEIENLLVGHPQVRQAIVGIQRATSASIGSDRDSLVAYIVLEKTAGPEIQDLRDYLKRKLPEYMLPSAFIFLDSMPLFPNGKIDRQALMAVKISQLSQNEYLAPVTPLEQLLARIWGEILEVEQIGLHDNFFELGGNSLLAMGVVNRIEHLLQTNFDLHSLFKSSDLQDYAKTILEGFSKQSRIKDIAQLLVKLDSLSDDQAQAILVTLETEKGYNLDA